MNPNMFWLCCPDTIRRIARLESLGLIHTLSDRLAASPDAAAQFRGSHERYMEERWGMLSSEQREYVRGRGWGAYFERGGIGGIKDWGQIKCLHLHYAHYLASREGGEGAEGSGEEAGRVGGNVVGGWVHRALRIFVVVGESLAGYVYACLCVSRVPQPLRQQPSTVL